MARHHKLKRNYLPSNRLARLAAMKFGGFLCTKVYWFLKNLYNQNGRINFLWLGKIWNARNTIAMFLQYS